jgi:DNA-binding MurR/RpiR family transcriptional regulator
VIAQSIASCKEIVMPRTPAESDLGGGLLFADMDVAERIRVHSASLTAAERRVATAILESPQAVGFGTVADLARTAGVGAASVVRLANKLGFDGYSELQQSIQDDLSAQLRPAAERIHEGTSASVAAHATAELANVRSTLAAVPDAALAALVARLTDLDRQVLIVSGDASGGVARQFASELAQLRSNVVVVEGSQVTVSRQLALSEPTATAIIIDLRRYERWVLDAHATLADRNVWSAAITDSVLSPIATRADATFLVTGGAVGPFDSHVGTLALLNLVTTAVATALRATAADRLAAIEAAWSSRGALTQGM